MCPGQWFVLWTAQQHEHCTPGSPTYSVSALCGGCCTHYIGRGINPVKDKNKKEHNSRPIPARPPSVHMQMMMTFEPPEKQTVLTVQWFKGDILFTTMKSICVEWRLSVQWFYMNTFSLWSMWFCNEMICVLVVKCMYRYVIQTYTNYAKVHHDQKSMAAT